MKKGKILLIDDDIAFLTITEKILGYAGYRVDTDSDPVAAIKRPDLGDFDLIITDLVMPQIDGIEVIKSILARHPHKKILVLTGNATIETAVEAMKQGAYTYIEKPVESDRLLRKIEEVFYFENHSDEEALLIDDSEIYVGESPEIAKVLKMVEKIAKVESGTLILGESGTGKEVIASLIHKNSNRRNGPFIKINCAAIPESLFESELFGFVRGAFTGAIKDTKGKMELARGGTLFLDEIGDLSLLAQTKILRAIQEKEIYRIGGEASVEIDFRLICATNKDLRKMVEEEKFREDLYYRINVATINLPPLRERSEDIDGFIEYYRTEFEKKFEKQIPAFSKDVMASLQNYCWPGNIRELKNVIERIYIFGEVNREVTLLDLPAEILNYDPGSLSRNENNMQYKDAKYEFEKNYIEKMLVKNNWNVSKTAEEIGLSRRNLHEKINQFQLNRGRLHDSGR